MSLDSRFAAIATVEASIRKGLGDLGLSLIAVRNRVDAWVPLPKLGLAALYPPLGVTLHEFRMTPDDRVTGCLTWIVPPGAVVSVRARVDLSLHLAPELGFDLAANVLCGLGQSLNAYWGEIVTDALTGNLTMCPLHGHESTVPHLGLANYFGPEYIEFFGGVRLIERAGFADVRPIGTGLLVKIPSVERRDEYRRVRSRIEAALADPSVFDPKQKGAVPQL